MLFNGVYFNDKFSRNAFLLVVYVISAVLFYVQRNKIYSAILLFSTTRSYKCKYPPTNSIYVCDEGEARLARLH